MKVLIGVDGSSNAFAAVEFVGRLLSAERDELVLLFATPAMSFDDERLDPSIEDRARAALSRAVLEAALERLPPAWKEKAQQRQLSGSASTALLEAIDAEKADMIAVGFRGTGGIVESFVLGSVSRAIVHTAKVPALVVKSVAESDKPANQSPGPLTRHMHVLAAVEDPAAAYRGVEFMKQFTWPEETRGWVMTVIKPMMLHNLPDWVHIKRDPDIAAMADAWQSEHKQSLQKAREELDKFRAALPECFTKEEIVIAEGRPAETLLEVIHEKAIDLAVLGSRGRGAMQRLLLGSTSEEVLREAPCSVLIVR
jgi:nucleotide-binding universal stress UspA family protein